MGSAPTACIISVGDELLRGDTVNTNSAFLCKELTARGVRVLRSLTIPDLHDVIVAEVRAAAAACNSLFVVGGIGPTPDDLTRGAVAEALGLPLLLNEEAVRNYTERRGALNAGQLEMCRLPAGCELIWPEVPTSPGCRIDNVFVLPGVPQIMQMMWRSIAHQFNGAPLYSARFQTTKGESHWAHIMADFTRRFPHLSFGSYPKMGEKWWVELLVRGPVEEEVEQVAADFAAAIAELGG